MSMTRTIRFGAAALTLAFASLAFSSPVHADDTGVKGEMQMWLKDAHEKLVDLSEAMPAAKYSWRPGKGVRSVGEVYMHVAAANFGVPSFAGVKPPEGFDIQTFERSKTKKEEIRKALKDSFEHMEEAFEHFSDSDLERPVDLFGMKTTVRGAYMLLLTHAHEHLGQSIAYARSNGVVPPWTAKQKAELSLKKKAETK